MEESNESATGTTSGRAFQEENTVIFDLTRESTHMWFNLREDPQEDG